MKYCLALFLTLFFFCNVYAQDININEYYGLHQGGMLFIEREASYKNISHNISNVQIAKDIKNILSDHRNIQNIAIPLKLEYFNNAHSIGTHCRVLLFDVKHKLIVYIGSSNARYLESIAALNAIKSETGYEVLKIITHEQKPNMCKFATKKHLEMLSKGIPYNTLQIYFENFKGDYSILPGE